VRTGVAANPLELAKTKGAADGLSAPQIVACLQSAGVAFSELSITRALARAGAKVAVSRRNDVETIFRIMTLGRRQVEKILSGELLSVVRVEAGMPRTARLRLGEVLTGLSGDIRVCDPYFGLRSLDALDSIPRASSIKFLTANTSESQGKIRSAVADFLKERPGSEFRLAAPGHGIHDRYVIAEDHLLLLGHGLKDVGGKESFIVRLDKGLVPDLLQELAKSFDVKWQAATRI
jgi:hypothetical protein